MYTAADIQEVMDATGCTRDEAIKALNKLSVADAISSIRAQQAAEAVAQAAEYERTPPIGQRG